MFSSVSKAGASALGLLYNSAEDAKLAFRTKQQGGVKRLQGGETISPNDVAYWSQFYMLFDSASEVYSLITLEDIRQTLILNPVNLQSLITFLSNHLFSLLSSPLFPSPISTSTLTSLLPSRSSSSSADPTAEALNCLRVLGRILPVLYEAEGLEGSNLGDEEGRRFVQEVLWRKGEETLEEEEEGEGEDQFVIDDDDDEEGEDGLGTAEQPSTPGAPKKKGSRVVDVPSLADRLFHTVVDLMFTEGFTLPPGVGGAGGDKVNYCIWERGVGSTVNVGSTAQLDENKVEVLRFFLLLLSTPIYTPPPLLPSIPSLPLLLLTHKTERRLVLSLLCSFLNTALNPNPVALLGVLPYSHLLAPGGKGIGGFGGGAGGREGREGLRKKALQGLLAGLDYWCEEGTAAGRSFGENGEEETVVEKKGNAFRFFVSKLHRKDDLAFILDGILAILAQHLEVANGLLPGSTRAPPMLLEIFMLLWRLIDLNKKFRAYILADEKRTIDVMTYTIFTSLQLKDNLAHHGLLRMCAYILQTLSADRAFGIAITSSPVTLALPAKYVVPGSAADFLITSIYSITTTSGLNSLFPALTITVANVAPYLKDLGVQASTRLIQLFSAFSSPAFLLKDEAHPRLVNYMLETFNSVIFHQLSNNPNLVYAILGAHQRFQFLATFTLKAGLREVLRVQQARAVAAEKAKRSESRNGADPGTPTDEKSGLIYRSDSENNASRQTLDLSREYASPPPSNARPPSVNSTTNLGSTTEEADEDDETPRETVAPLMTPGEQQQDPLSVTTPTTATATPTVMSEKARGKMRERNVEEGAEEGGGENGGGGGEVDDGVLGEELEKLRIGGLGSGGFVPSQEWVTSWQKGLPLDPILLFILELLPKVESLQTAKTQGPNKEIIKFLRSVTLLDVLPPAPPVIARKFLFSQTSQIWLTSLLWGEIYVSGMSPLGLWTGTSVKLFGVKAAPPGRRDIALKNVQSTLTSVFRSSSSNGNVSSTGERRPSAPARHSSSYSLSSRRSSVGGGAI